MIIITQKAGEIVGTNQNLFIDAIVDSPADLPAQNALDPYIIVCPSTIKCVSGERFMMDSGGNWIQQPEPTTVALSLADYYTKAQADATFTTPVQVDNFLQGYVGYCLPIDFNYFKQIPDNTDLDTITIVGTYYKNTNVSGLSNLPAGLTTAFKMIVENTSAIDRQKQWIYPITQTPAASMYWRIKTGGGWQPWYKLTGTLA